MEPIRLIYAGPIPNRNHRCRDWRTEWAFSKRCRKTFGELPPAMRPTRRAQRRLRECSVATSGSMIRTI